jgi:D-glycero-alpha-D-manno-heptose-7-phosphate kinase
MILNTRGQQALHPALVSDAAKSIIELAREHKCVGWKVNGAGGEGGSMSILCGPRNEDKRAFIRALPQINPMFQVIPTYLSRIGIRRWEVPA